MKASLHVRLQHWGLLLMGLSAAVAQQTPWDLRILSGRAALEQGRYAEAEKQFKEAVKEAERLDKNDPRLGWSLTYLGEALQLQGRANEAEPAYKRSLETLEKVLGPNHPEITGTLLGLARLYSGNSGRPARVGIVTMPLRVIAVVPGVAPGGAALPPAFPSGLAIPPLTGLGFPRDYKKAEVLYTRALAIQEHTLGPNHVEVGFTLNELGFTHRRRDQYAQAELAYQRALNILRNTATADALEVAICLNNLGEIYRIQKQFPEAEPYYREAITILQTAGENGRLPLAQVYENLADLLRKTGRKADAKDAETRAKTLRATRTRQQSGK